MKDIRIGIRLDTTTHDIAKRVAPEGNISMWIRSLIRKEIKAMNITNVQASEIIYRSLLESGYNITKSRILDSLDISRKDETTPFDMETALSHFMQECEHNQEYYK